MNELFHIDPDLPELIDVNSDPIKQWRFNGDRLAFVNSNFEDFHFLFLVYGNLIWFNENVVAFEEHMMFFSFDPLEAEVEIHFPIYDKGGFQVQFDDEIFTVIYVDHPSVEDEEILDMFLDSQGRRQIERLEIHSQFEHPTGLPKRTCPCCSHQRHYADFFLRTSNVKASVTT
jgi:hypothetical protein